MLRPVISKILVCVERLKQRLAVAGIMILESINEACSLHCTMIKYLGSMSIAYTRMSITSFVIRKILPGWARKSMQDCWFTNPFDCVDLIYLMA